MNLKGGGCFTEPQVSENSSSYLRIEACSGHLTHLLLSVGILHGDISSLRNPFRNLILLLCIPQGSEEVVLEREDRLRGVTHGVVPTPEWPQASPWSCDPLIFIPLRRMKKEGKKGKKSIKGIIIGVTFPPRHDKVQKWIFPLKCIWVTRCT